ncbi:MAG: diguanylate cyclase, partial [Myxococcota bacterium]
LRAQGYYVEGVEESIEGANRALMEPPAAVIADLWMPGVSGIQLCRLLQAEPATSEVPVILRADTDASRNRFWAERAGAAGYVVKGRMGELVRTLERVVRSDDGEAFFTHFAQSDIDIRDRIAMVLDEALFSSVLAAEVRALSTCGSFERLFDLFSQLVSQVTTYRWMAIASETPRHLGVHTNPADGERILKELPSSLQFSNNELLLIEDEDARHEETGCPPIVADIRFGEMRLGQMFLSPFEADPRDQELVSLLAREMSGPLRIVGLVEESHRMASIDPMTGLLNRRAMQHQITAIWNQAGPLSMLLIDLDHFKQLNDTYGHAAGDLMLSTVGQILGDQKIASRWGGEEFLVALPGADLTKAARVAETLRKAIQKSTIRAGEEKVGCTASIGCAEKLPTDTVEDLIDRADRAMYRAKSSGRDRVCREPIDEDEPAAA